MTTRFHEKKINIQFDLGLVDFLCRFFTFSRSGCSRRRRGAGGGIIRISGDKYFQQTLSNLKHVGINVTTFLKIGENR